MIKPLNLLVIGAGHGGQALAGNLAQMGHKIVLCPRTVQKAELMRQKRYIALSGCLKGKAKLEGIATDVKEALQGKDMTFIVTDATRHGAWAEILAPFAEGQHFVLFGSPGIGAALEFSRQINGKNPIAAFNTTETDTLLYACRAEEPGNVHVFGIKKDIRYATVSVNGRMPAFALKGIFPQSHDTEHPLVGLYNVGFQFHISGMIMNAEKVKAGKLTYFYKEAITLEVAKFITEMDNERRKVAEAVGVEAISCEQWLWRAYRTPRGSLYKMIQNTRAYGKIGAPDTLDHRYIKQEILLKALPAIEIGNVLGIEMPHFKEIVDKACELLGIDFWKNGRTLSDMGLDKAALLSKNKGDLLKVS